MCEGGEGGVGVCAPALGDVAGVLKGGGLVRDGWRSGGWGMEWGERVRGDSRRGLEGLVSGVLAGYLRGRGKSVQFIMTRLFGSAFSSL